MTETEVENCAVTCDVEGRRTCDCRGCCSSRWVDIVAHRQRLPGLWGVAEGQEGAEGQVTTARVDKQ